MHLWNGLQLCLWTLRPHGTQLAACYRSEGIYACLGGEAQTSSAIMFHSWAFVAFCRPRSMSEQDLNPFEVLSSNLSLLSVYVCRRQWCVLVFCAEMVALQLRLVNHWNNTRCRRVYWRMDSQLFRVWVILKSPDEDVFKLLLDSRMSILEFSFLKFLESYLMCFV